MKKMLILMVLLDCAVLAFSQQNKPVYVNDLFFAGVYACEFAENGVADEAMKAVEPFVKNGRLYFLSAGLPVTSGNLRPAFKFILSDNHKIQGEYNGRQTDYVNSTDAVAVAGFAEKGKIIITNVFLDAESLEKWADTVKLAE
jgi:hypothetical protein